MAVCLSRLRMEWRTRGWRGGERPRSSRAGRAHLRRTASRPRQRLYDGLLEANEAILDEAKTTDMRGMGTTAIVAIVQTVCSVGQGDFGCTTSGRAN